MRRLLMVIGFVWTGAGCGDDGEHTSQQSQQTSESTERSSPRTNGLGEARQTPRERPEAGPVTRTDKYEIRLAAAEPLVAGQPGQVELLLTGIDGWHVNQDYPTRIEVWGPEGVQLSGAAEGGPPNVIQLEKSDAAEFTDERARFDVGVTPSATAGAEAWAGAEVDFVMCTETSCTAPMQATVAMTLPLAGS